jgi:hypothetical protein
MMAPWIAIRGGRSSRDACDQSRSGSGSGNQLIALASVTLVLIQITGCGNQPSMRIRGQVIWTQERRTLTDCASNRVYQLRILASGPYVRFSDRIRDLSSGSSPAIVAEVDGSIENGRPSGAAPYPVDGTLKVDRIISVERGTCSVNGARDSGMAQ